MRFLVPGLIAALGMLAAPGLARSSDSVKLTDDDQAEEPADADQPDTSERTDPGPIDLVEARLSPVDGRTIRGMFIDLGEDDRLLLRYLPSADSGVEIERSTAGEVVWRVHAMPLGIRHTRYRHDIYAHVVEGRLWLRSDGTSGTFIEQRDIASGALIQRTEDEQAEADDDQQPAGGRDVESQADATGDEDPASPNRAEPRLTPVDGRTIRGTYIDLDEGDRLQLRYMPMADSGVEIERVTDGEVVWRVHAMPLGVIHSIYKHDIYAHANEGQLILHSDGSSGRFYERRDLENGELIERSEDD